MNSVASSDQPRAVTSPLLDKVRRLGMSHPLDLERLALTRGCDYYGSAVDQGLQPASEVPLSNTELAIALLLPSLRPTAREIRLAAAILGAPDAVAEEVAALAVQENCADIVSYIAACGRRFEPENAFWQTLLTRLPEVRLPAEGLPHPTRFVEMTGIVRGKVGLFTRWIRARGRASA